MKNIFLKFSKIFGKNAKLIVVGIERKIRLPLCLKCFSNRVSGSERNVGKSPVPIRSVDEAPTGAALCGYKEQVSTSVPNSAFAPFATPVLLVGECLPQTLLMRLAPPYILPPHF